MPAELARRSGWRERGDHRPKAFQLHLIQRGRPRLRRRGGCSACRSQARRAPRLGRPQAEPVHAGIDHDVAGPAGAICFQRATCSSGVQARARGQCAALLRHRQARRHEARPGSRSSASCPSASASAQVDTKKSRHPDFEERFGRLARAEAVAVRFHRRARRNPGAVRRASASSTGSRRGRRSGAGGGASPPP